MNKLRNEDYTHQDFMRDLEELKQLRKINSLDDALDFLEQIADSEPEKETNYKVAEESMAILEGIANGEIPIHSKQKE